MKNRILNILLAGLAIYLPMSLPGATNSWIGGSGDWGVATNWSTGALPGPGDYVVIGSGPGITVTHSSNLDTVISIQSQQALVLSGGSITVTSNASQLNGSFTISNGATLGATGPGTTFLCSGPAIADDANFSVAGGAVVTLPTLQNFTKECNGANWTVTGSNSILNLPALTNMTGAACNFPVIQAEAGGQILASNVVSIQAGPLTFQADGTNSSINLSGLTTCAGQNGYLVSFEASSGGTVRIPNMTGGPLLGVTINPGGSINTAQIQMLNTLDLPGVTNNFNALTNVVNLTVSGVTINFPALINFNDGNITVSGGAAVTMPALQNYAKYCNGANWTVTGSNSVLNLPALTNMTGEACNFPVIQAEAGGQIVASNVASIQAGPLAFQADGANSLINLSRLATCAGQNGFLVNFEASSGGTVQIPNMTGGPLLGVTINPGGSIPTAQIQMLNTLDLPGVTNNFNALTNVVNLTVSGVTMNFPALINFDDGNATVSGGAVVTMPALQSYTKLSCSGANWTVTGAGSVLNLPALAGIAGETCNFPVIQAEAGGEILATNVVSILVAPLSFQADGANSLINLSALTTCAGQDGYLVNFEASSGGTVLIPNMTGGPLLGVTVNPGGSIPTAQIRMLNTLSLPGLTNNFNALTNVINLSVSGVTMNFPDLINFDDGNITVSGGAVVTMPVLQNYTKLTCYGANWTVTGSGSVLNLPALTNIAGETCSFPVIQAEAGGEILATNLAGIQLGPLTFQADGAGSLIDLNGLTNGSGQDNYLLTFEASGGGTLQIPKMAGGQLVGLTFNPGGFMAPTNLVNLNQGSITLPGGSLSLPALRDMDATSLNVSGGAALSLSGVGSYAAGTDVGAVWEASGTGSQISLPGLTNLTGDGNPGTPMQIEATAGGQLLLSNLQSVANGSMAFLSDGAGSTINLTSLSGFVIQNGQGSVTAQNGGTILLNNQAFLLANVAINIPAGNPVLPPTLIASTTLTLYGQAWDSYLVEERNTLIPNSPFIFFARVPLTNSFEAIAPAPAANTAYLVTEFVANPPVLDLSATVGQVQLVLYGATNKTYQIETKTNLNSTVTWTNSGGSVVLTNSFRIFPPTTPAQPSLFYRAQQF